MKKYLLFIALIFLSFISIFIGSNNILNQSTSALEIVMISRVPRVISLIIAGAGLSISGVIMQQITRNKFTSPTTAGTMDCAKFGILMAMIIMPSSGILVKSLFSFTFAMIGSIVFTLILSKIKIKNVILVPLIGMMFGNLIGAATDFFSYYFELNQAVNAWFQGSFSGIMKGNYELLYICIPMVIITFLYAEKFMITGMGESFAKNLGLNYKRIMYIGMILVSAISSLTLVMAGSIPFIGLIVPNIIRLIKGDNIKNTLTETAAFGAVFLLICDIFGRIIIKPYEVSIGLTVGVIGSMIFLYLIMRGEKKNAVR